MSHLSGFFILLLVGSSFSLSCYKCKNCKEEDPTTQDCGTIGGDACLKFEVGEMVSKICIQRELCSISKAEETLKDAWASFKNIFDFSNDTPEKDEKKAVNCCFTDYCNGSESLQLKNGLVVASLVALFYANM